MCWFAYAVGQTVGRLVAQAGKAHHLRRSGLSMRLKRRVLSALFNLYAVVMLYLILPMVMGTVFELYVGMPMRYGFEGRVAPVLHVWDTW